MKYLIASILSLFAVPLMAHHAEDTVSFQAADQTATWLVLIALSLGLLAISRRHTLRGSQD